MYNIGSVGDFTVSDKGSIDFQKGGITNIEEELKRVLDYEITSNNDTKRNIKSGMFASKTISHNIYQKTLMLRHMITLMTLMIMVESLVGVVIFLYTIKVQ